MEEQPVEGIRESSRHQLFFNRRRLKDKETDVRRSLENLRTTKADISTIASKLKTKSSISASQLKVLQNALVDDPGNVEVVMNTHGALRGLVRELTGHDVSKQLASCTCLCNLSLSDSKTCCVVAEAAGTYLVAALDTLTTQLSVCCAWTLGNLAGSGTKACDVIVSQGAVAKLCDVMDSGPDVRDAAVYALTHAAYVMRNHLRSEHLQKIIQSLSIIELNTDTLHLLFLLSCHRDFTPQLLPESYIQKIVQILPLTIDHHVICKGYSTISAVEQSSKCCDVVYLMRVLANLNCETVYKQLVNYFVSSDYLERALDKDVDDNFLWLLGNIINCCASAELMEKLSSL